MFRERTRCCRRLLVGLTAAALLLVSLPATGLAAERENQSAALAEAALLAPGAGYGTDAGSKAVRQLQLRLRRLGDRPGPIDGLYGPRTAAAVVRFQRSHGLAIDGVVGPQTKGRLLAQRVEQRPARAPSPPTQTGNPERKSPAPDTRAESVPEPLPVRPSAGVAIGRAEPESSSSGLPPLLVAIGAAFVVASLLLTLRSRRREAIEARLNLGLVCAALIAACVLGAAIGALFATQAAPDDNDRTTADSGALLASRTGPAEPATSTSAKTTRAATARASAATGRAGVPARSRAKRARAGAIRSGAGTASTAPARATLPSPAPGPASPAPRPASPGPRPAAPATSPAPAPAPPTAPSRAPSPALPAEGPANERGAEAVTYTVRPGDSLWPIARDHLAPSSSDNEVARKVGELKELNIEDRIQSGDPDVIVSGEELRVR